MKPEVFVADRSGRLDRFDKVLQPTVERALAHWGEKDWYVPIVQSAQRLWDDITPNHMKGDAEFVATLSDTLKLTGDPEHATENQASLLTSWVSTFTANHAEHSRGKDAGHLEIRWLTRLDDKVRALHREVEGQTVPFGSKFEVGGYHLRFPGDPVGPPNVWINCRCLAQSLEGTMTAAADPQIDDADVIGTPVEVPFHGIAAPTDTPSGDNRMLAKDGFSTRPMPIPLNYQRGSSHGGDSGPAVTVGRIDSMGLDVDGMVRYTGVFSPNIPEAGEAIQHIVDGTMRGVSVDVDSAQEEYQDLPSPSDFASDAEFVDAMQNVVQKFKKWRISGLTMCSIPAFAEAHIQLGAPQTAATEPHQEADPAVAASLAVFAPGTHDGPGWLTDPIPTERLRHYWVSGEGAAKIGWGIAGDFDRCRAHIGKYVPEPHFLAGECANMHHDATGAWPGHAPTEMLASGAPTAPAVTLVASAAPLPIEWFQDPNLSAPTPFTVMDDGRVFGHVATWGTCHVGIRDRCTTAPHSNTGYAYYRTGAVRTTAGDVPVGHITMSAGHADLRAGAQAAAAHYDNVATAVADVAAGEDIHGIWVAGALRPGVTDEQRHGLKAAALSGDWREIRGNLELVAALAVNVPGFPIPRVGLAASGAEQTTLVAAGIVAGPEMITMADASTDTSQAPAAAPDAPPEAPEADPVEDPNVALIRAVDAAIDTTIAFLQAQPENTPGVQQALDLAVAADTAIDSLMVNLGIPDPEDEAGQPGDPLVPGEGITAAAFDALIRAGVERALERRNRLATTRAQHEQVRSFRVAKTGNVRKAVEQVLAARKVDSDAV